MTVSLQTNPDNFSAWSDVKELLQESFAYMDGRIDPPSSLHRLDAESLGAKGANEHVVIASDDGKLIGCAFGAPRQKSLYLGKIAVLDTYRGQGIARSMVDALEDVARDLGLTYLELESRIELTENREAFSQMGFVQTGTSAHDGYDRPTSISMCKAVISF